MSGLTLGGCWEQGLEVALEEAFSFTYRSTFSDGLCEHEYDHVFLARHDTDPSPDPSEARQSDRSQCLQLLVLLTGGLVPSAATITGRLNNNLRSFFSMN